ncbi:MAG: amidohydrolase family protein [Euryarchaeota archaeon]|nr:amidohydrolase family protein [Euryarchaeota archaeon]
MDVLIKGGTLVTMDREQGILKNFSVAVEDGRIVEVAERIPGEADFVIDARGKVVIPGLVNTHTHAAMTLFRGAADDLPLHRWLQEEIWPVEAKLKPQHVYAGTLLACLEMLTSGITCFNDMYFYLEEAARAAEEAGMRAVLSYPLLDVAGEEQGRELLKVAENGLRRFRDSELVRVFVGPHAPYTCSEELLLSAVELAEKYETRIHIHVSETREEVERFLREKGMRPVEYLESIGFLSDRVLIAHGVHLSREEQKLVSSRGAKISHNPVSNMKLGAGVAPVTEYIRAGITVALGTDGAASNNVLDMFQEMKTCALLQKVTSGDASALPAVEALKLATLNGAMALGMHNAGVIRSGAVADITVVNMRRPHLTPLSNPVSHLVYAAKGSDVSDVLVNGRVVVQNGRCRTLDAEEVERFALKQARELFESAGRGDRLFTEEVS